MAARAIGMVVVTMTMIEKTKGGWALRKHQHLVGVYELAEAIVRQR